MMMKQFYLQLKLLKKLKKKFNILVKLKLM